MTDSYKDFPDFAEIRKYIQSRQECYEELAQKSKKLVRQGDIVIVAVGLIGHGYDWGIAWRTNEGEV